MDTSGAMEHHEVDFNMFTHHSLPTEKLRTSAL